ncbi:MAG: leucine-rich repeat domain-containing protein, partial [Paludibacteraceae bacterium]|nr:leucine-rich repeat domain-containing protein [Paludibacteraceae bacterium]
MRKIFTFLFAALMSVGMFATTVTWDNSTLSSIYLQDGESFTQDGVTVTSLIGMIYGENGQWMGNSNDASFKFSTSLGNFTKIEITATIHSFGGSGWTQTSPGAVWTGEANETTFGEYVSSVSQIVFTIEPAGAVPSWVKSGDVWDDATKTLTVNSNLPANAYKAQTEIEHVIISSGVTSIGNSAFDGCSGLTSVTSPNSVTSIGYATFAGCTGLTSITIPISVISIGNAAFYGCSGLTSIT